MEHFGYTEETDWRERGCRGKGGEHVWVEMFNLQSVQGPDPSQESPGSEEPIQVHALGVHLLAVSVQPVAEVVELGLGEGRGGARYHLLPEGEVGAYIHPHSTQA